MHSSIKGLTKLIKKGEEKEKNQTHTKKKPIALDEHWLWSVKSVGIPTTLQLLSMRSTTKKKCRKRCKKKNKTHTRQKL